MIFVEAPNILTCILNLDADSRGDPYRVWIANVILLHLIHDDLKVKELAASIREGDAEAGLVEEIIDGVGIFKEPDAEKHQISDCNPGVIVVFQSSGEVGANGLDCCYFLLAGFCVALPD